MRMPAGPKSSVRKPVFQRTQEANLYLVLVGLPRHELIGDTLEPAQRRIATIHRCRVRRSPAFVLIEAEAAAHLARQIQVQKLYVRRASGRQRSNQVKVVLSLIGLIFLVARPWVKGIPPTGVGATSVSDVTWGATSEAGSPLQAPAPIVTKTITTRCEYAQRIAFLQGI